MVPGCSGHISKPNMSHVPPWTLGSRPDAPDASAWACQQGSVGAIDRWPCSHCLQTTGRMHKRDLNLGRNYPPSSGTELDSHEQYNLRHTTPIWPPWHQPFQKKRSRTFVGLQPKMLYFDASLARDAWILRLPLAVDMHWLVRWHDHPQRPAVRSKHNVLRFWTQDWWWVSWVPKTKILLSELWCLPDAVGLRSISTFWIQKADCKKCTNLLHVHVHKCPLQEFKLPQNRGISQLKASNLSTPKE